jgi:transcription factor E
MIDKLLKEIVSFVVGKSVEEIAEVLNSKKHVNEFLIAKKMDLTINQVRNILYKLADKGLVSSIRKKDKKKGWYTYFWKIEILKSLEFLKEILLKRKEQILAQIKSRETKEFYSCKRCNIEFTEENALLRDFTCAECGEIFSRKDNSKLIKEFLKQEIKISSELALIEAEIQKELQKKGKLVEKEAKKADKKAKELKEVKKIERAKLKKKNNLLQKDKKKDSKNKSKKKLLKKSNKSSTKKTIKKKIKSKKGK